MGQNPAAGLTAGAAAPPPPRPHTHTCVFLPGCDPQWQKLRGAGPLAGWTPDRRSLESLSVLALDSSGLCEQTSLRLFPLTPLLLVTGGMSLDRDTEEQVWGRTGTCLFAWL